jgi:hypothetical protein
VATGILLLVGALGVAFFLWSPSWLGPPEPPAPEAEAPDGEA